ncbi:hypothetical protein EV426DRAFT_584348 [Tirmania nivea]|nr:hypothetical protein EV426DRAFT_584348 [Tirmania nivea]
MLQVFAWCFLYLHSGRFFVNFSICFGLSLRPSQKQRNRESGALRKGKILCGVLFFDSFIFFYFVDTNVLQFLVHFMLWRYVLYTLGWLFCLSLACIRLH